MTRRRRRRPWKYHRVKTILGELIKGSSVFRSGSLCNSWPSKTITYPAETYCGNYEFIDYYIKSKPYVEQPCFHVKNCVDRFSIPGYTYDTLSKSKCSDGIYRPLRTIVEKTDYYGTLSLSDGYRLPNLPNLNQSHREALEFFASGCQPIIANWAVTAFEVKGLIDLAKQAFSAAKLFRKLANAQIPYSWGMLLRKLQRMSADQYTSFLAKNLSKEAANAFLEYSFAIKPLLSDIAKTALSLNDLSSRIASFRKNCKIPVKVNFSKDISDAFPIEATSYPPVENTTADSVGTNVFRTYYRAFYTASAKASYDVSGLSDNDIAYRLAKQAYGFADPLLLLWERVPFSFVIDWVFKVGDYISSLPSLSTFPYALSQVTHSLRIQQTNVYLAHFYVGSRYTPRILVQQPVFTDVIYYYKRDLGIPLTFSGMDTSLPGFQQLMLALALGRQFFK